MGGGLYLGIDRLLLLDKFLCFYLHFSANYFTKHSLIVIGVKRTLFDSKEAITLEFDEFYMTGTKDEIENFQRIIDFGEDKTSISKMYEQLDIHYKACVNTLIQTLNKNTDFFGYNLKRVLTAYEQTEPIIKHRTMKRMFMQVASFYNVNFDYLKNTREDEEFFEKSTLKYLDKKLDDTKLKHSFDEKNNIESSKLVKNICDNLLIDLNLLKKGIGKVWVINDLYYDAFIQDSAFGRLVEKYPDKTYSTRMCFNFYEKYLKKNGKLISGQPVLIETWAVITYSGAYQRLKPRAKTASNEKQEAVDKLIKDLCKIQASNEKIFEMYASLPRMEDIK